MLGSEIDIWWAWVHRPSPSAAQVLDVSSEVGDWRRFLAPASPAAALRTALKIALREAGGRIVVWCEGSAGSEFRGGFLLLTSGAIV